MHKLATSLLWFLVILGREKTFDKQRLAALDTEGRLIRSKNQQDRTLGSTWEISTLPIPLKVLSGWPSGLRRQTQDSIFPIPLNNGRKGLKQEVLKKGYLQSWCEHPLPSTQAVWPWLLHQQVDPEFLASRLARFKKQDTLVFDSSSRSQEALGLPLWPSGNPEREEAQSHSTEQAESQWGAAQPTASAEPGQGNSTVQPHASCGTTEAWWPDPGEVSTTIQLQASEPPLGSGQAELSKQCASFLGLLSLGWSVRQQ